MIQGRSISLPEIIAIVGCPQCDALPGKQCTFSRLEDHSGKRAVAKQSHDDRVKKAKEIWGNPLDIKGFRL
jgi:hypothetical protein